MNTAASEIEMTCDFCNGKFKFPAEGLNMVAPCPFCKKDVVLSEPVVIVHKKESPKQSVTVETKPSSMIDTLSGIRQQTCYQTYRSLVNVLFYLMIAVAIGYLLFDLQMRVSNYYEFSEPHSSKGLHAMEFISFWSVVINLSLSGMVVFLAIAFRQGAFILADIADVLISNSKSKG